LQFVAECGKLNHTNKPPKPMISDYKKKLIKSGALDYLIHDNGSGKVYFNKTKKESKEEMRKMQNYSSPRLYSAKRKRTSGIVLIYNMEYNHVSAIGDMSDGIIQSTMENPMCRTYFLSI
jgi:hypothetical protein